jgi:hypothetical protein
VPAPTGGCDGALADPATVPVAKVDAHANAKAVAATMLALRLDPIMPVLLNDAPPSSHTNEHRNQEPSTSPACSRSNVDAGSR